ncbi:hypothetical protein QJS66_05245 [Kocuria rhizophila]|nr:hypothetical protein QJS66_05245 [Kocuria rhizophila]
MERNSEGLPDGGADPRALLTCSPAATERGTAEATRPDRELALPQGGHVHVDV